MKHPLGMDAAVLIIPNPLMREGVESALLASERIEIAGSFGTLEEALDSGARGTVVLLHCDAAGDFRRDCAELAARCADEVVVLAREGDPEAALACLRGGARAIVLEHEGRLELTAAIAAVGSGAAHLDGRLLRQVLDMALRAARLDEALSPRERLILALLAAGHSSTEIGARLELAPKTVRNICTGVYAKLGAQTRTQAVAVALGAGLIAAEAV